MYPPGETGADGKRNPKNMKTNHLLILCVLLVALLSACAPRTNEGSDLPEAPAATGTTVADYEWLLEALRADGLVVEPAGTPEDPFFPVEAYSIIMDEAQVSVFQFRDEAAAVEAAATVNATGTIIGTTIVDWAEPPHFYRQGRLIALYAGENEVVLEALATALGAPFVIGQGLLGSLPDPGGPQTVLEPETDSSGFCPEFPRPAMLLYRPGEKHFVLNPAAGAGCD